MIVLLGASGYIGRAFEAALVQQREPFLALSRREVDYTRYDVLTRYLESCRATFVINAAGYTGKPNVDACEIARADTLQGNTLFPLLVSHACAAVGIPWGHVSSGCIYSGAVVDEGETRRIEKDLMTPPMQLLVASNRAAIHGFTESDEPNFTFRQPPCSFYSGCKALAEEVLTDDRQVYLWRMRLPFNEIDGPRNYLSKLQRYAKIYDNVNSVSHLDDFVHACLDLWNRRAPFGIYNVTNPGYVTARQVIKMIQKVLRPNREFDFWQNDAEFYKQPTRAIRSNCVLDTAKLLASGVKIRTVEEAISDALSRWQPEKLPTNQISKQL